MNFRQWLEAVELKKSLQNMSSAEIAQFVLGKVIARDHNFNNLSIRQKAQITVNVIRHEVATYSKEINRSIAPEKTFTDTHEFVAKIIDTCLRPHPQFRVPNLIGLLHAYNDGWEQEKQATTSNP
jgi:hypothetical protein